MGSDNKAYSQKRGKFKTLTKFWAVIFTLASVGLLGTLVYVNILPVKLLIIAVAVVAFFWIVFFPALYSRRIKIGRKIVSLILTFFLISGYSVGIMYLTGTLDFLDNITGLHEAGQEYLIVAKAKDSKYNKMKDVAGKKVYSVENDGVYDDQARKILQKQYGGISRFKEDATELLDGLYNKEYDLIMLDVGDEAKAKVYDEAFETNTKVIGKIFVNIKNNSKAKRVDVKRDSYNILISGMDTEGSINTVSRSDVNMVVTVNPKTKTVLLTSIPRDYRIHMKTFGNAGDKLTHTGIYGTYVTVDAVQDLMDIDINYYVKVNFSTVRKLVDAIGGIEVVSDRDLSLQDENGDWYTYKEGPNNLNGHEALRFARERESYPEGDIHRNKNQQDVMKAIIEKSTSSYVILSKYSKILNGIEDYITTNMKAEEIKSIIRMQLGDMSGWNIEAQNLTGEGNLANTYTSGDFMVYVMEQDPESIKMANDKIEKLMRAK